MRTLAPPLPAHPIVHGVGAATLGCVAWQGACWWFAFRRGLRMNDPAALWAFVRIGGAIGARIAISLREMLPFL